MRTMNEKMIRAAIGKTGDSALKLVAVEYLNYIIKLPEFLKKFYMGFVGMEKRKQQSFLMIIYLYI